MDTNLRYEIFEKNSFKGVKYGSTLIVSAQFTKIDFETEGIIV